MMVMALDMHKIELGMSLYYSHFLMIFTLVAASSKVLEGKRRLSRGSAYMQ
jgi:hypothetical protein